MNLRYLLLTGKRRDGRQRTTVSVFANAGEADAEFRRRGKHLPRDGWLELLSIDDQGRIARLRRSDDQVQAASQRSASVGSAPMWTCT